MTPLELRLNPRVLDAPDRGPVRFALGDCEVELTPGELRRMKGDEGALLRETLRRARLRRHVVPARRTRLVFGPRTRVMGILNVTPDSFSDGGAWLDPDRAVRHARRMVREGADLIDVGGESTRPGARPVSAREELRRVIPVVRRLARDGIPVSIDTSKAAVAEAAFGAGACMLNDVTALRGDRRMAAAAKRAGAAVMIMHMRGRPRTMQRNPRYGDVVGEICAELRAALKRAWSAGIGRDRIILDPGIGFGKTPDHNVAILRRLREFRSLGCPVAVGTSRKSFIGHALGRSVADRLAGTAATVAAAVLRGAGLVRVHDVREMSDVTRMTDLLR